MVTEDNRTLFHIKECAWKAQCPVFDVRGRNLSFGKAGAERDDTLPLRDIAISTVDVHGRHERGFSVDDIDFCLEKLGRFIIVRRAGGASGSRCGWHDFTLFGGIVVLLEDVRIIYVSQERLEAERIFCLESRS